VLIGEAPLLFSELVAGEPLPLGSLHVAILEFIRGREDAVILGAYAVNVYVSVFRMTQDLDLASPRALDLSGEICECLSQRFHIAVRVRDVRDGLGYRIYQVRKAGRRHLVDLRPVPVLPPSQRVGGFLVVTPEELVAGKLSAFVSRRDKPKSGTDWRDLAMLLLTFPELKTSHGLVRDRLLAAGVDAAVLTAWEELVAQEILPEEEDDEFNV